MKERCYARSNPSYQHYGGRGITVCEKWIDSFENFLEDMGRKPPGFFIDRIDFNGNYEPSNCRWVSVADSNRNRRKPNYQGELVVISKLTSEEVMEIRKLHAAGFTQAKLAEQFNVTVSNIWAITQRRTWKHI